MFSFAKLRQYLKAFSGPFGAKVFTISIISPEALQFRNKFKKKWGEALALGYTEEDLLTKGLLVIAKK